MVAAFEQGRSADFNGLAKASYVALAKLAQAALGTGPVAVGLACSAGTGLHVVVSPGELYSQAQTDPTGFGSLPADTHVVLKQAILADAVTLSTPAPSTAGQTIVYLVEAQLQESDGGSQVTPFYNASNPAVPFYQSTNTLRSDACAVQVKAGAAAATGSQVTPVADPGWTALYEITVNSGDAAPTIRISYGAPFLIGSLTLPGGKVRTVSGAVTVHSVDQWTTFIASATTTFTLPSLCYVTPGWRVPVRARGGNVVIAPRGSDLIEGASTYALPRGDSAEIVADDQGGWTLLFEQGPPTGVYVNANFNAAPGRIYHVDTSGGPVVATLPATPAIGENMRFIDCNRVFGVYAFTMARNGHTIMTTAEDMIADVNDLDFMLRWSGTDWRLE